ncbi:YegP family protein [Pseudoxanthomonas indica]|uniref:DUF1508 domain-containing protein n=1 Tax=Pseudoxanthomonas indica TaxID=428993 RepID=A0A1T5LYT5_9GAMM|nr:YegP family protein [Pseudoxanthomonas indica]GGD42342.1 hypothetical protein GCM10007235_12960 [Pseudoxanthomonas indica]SKC80984.1 hypothetical protein SAMN06296058_3425 [Pseudoxanthomonas indica]HVL08430.1 YegP family protein [Burkholderiaceae bacterium]
MAAKFFITRTEQHHHFVLKAGNGQQMLVSPQFTKADDCQQAIEAIRESPSLPDRFQLSSVANGKCLFHVVDRDARIVGTSQLYSSEVTRAAGIASVCVSAGVAKLVEA